MKLLDLLKKVNVIKILGKKDVDVKEIVFDSNKVTKGSLFVCLKGLEFDGYSYIKQVEQYGGIAIVCEREVETNLTQIIVDDCRKALSLLSSAINNYADTKIRKIGVVGTNGKTSTTHFITSILMGSGVKCGLIGTLGTFYNGEVIAPTLTTPDPPELHKSFAEMLKKDIDTVVMENSAHAISLKKLEGLTFEQGIFTNLSQDHLDFFGNMQRYRQTKLEFFDQKCKYIITNSDDELGREILKKNSKAITYGIDNPADVFAVQIKERQGYTSFVLNLFDEIYHIKLNVIGRFNVLNALAAACSAALYGISTDKIAEGLEELKGVDGRLQLIYKERFSVYIDYAHTPDGLSKSLLALKSLTKSRLICVFGCGGNRDASKRSVMGAISGELADFTIITNDNPRFEEPMEIIWQIEKGVLQKTKNYVIVEERAEAINYALNMAKEGDVVLIAGKGSEQYQEVFGIKRMYNDKDTVEEYISSRGR